MSTQTVDSAFARRAAIANFIREGVTDNRPAAELFIDGKAVSDEAVMWDFKREMPVPIAAKVNQHTQKQHDAKMSDIVKDAVAFHNTFGGYIIAGVDDKTRIAHGFDLEFNAADLNKKIEGATGSSIETIYRIVDVDLAGATVKLGVLFVPRRADDAKPVQFNKDAPENPAGKRAYAQGDIYIRERDNCIPAKSVGQLEFSFGKRNLEFQLHKLKVLDHNLPPRDFDLINLIGREQELSQLWAWLPDPFSPLKILSGVGGVGKTSIAYTFAERLIYKSPDYIDKLIWLGAKEMGYGPLSGRVYALPRLDFRSIDRLLVELLAQTGCPAEQIPDDPSQNQLLSLAESHLSAYSYLLVIDNVDSLKDDEQQQIFFLFMQLCSISRTKAIITARRNLGAARSVYTEVQGLSFPDFQTFVVEKCQFLRITPALKRESREIEELFDASGGSPLFALSILRLVVLGDSFRDALQNWRGSDGDDVRRAAFEREIGRLNAAEGKVLLVLCYLEQASVAEISKLLSVTRFEVQSALETLGSFSMTVSDHSIPSGATFRIPITLSLVSSLVESRVPDWKEIRKSCESYLKLRGNPEPFVAATITKTMMLLRSENHSEALITAASAIGALTDSPDLYCLLGRVYLAMDDSRAEDAYKKSFELGCRKRELLDGWIEHRQKRLDWKGVIEISAVGEREHKAARYCESLHHAEMMIADQFSRTGKYPEADRRYETAIESLRRAIPIYRYPSDQNNLIKLKDSLVIRWLGVVRESAAQQSGWQVRYFGACHKAIVFYDVRDENVFKYSLSAIQDWLERVDGRGKISDTAISQMRTTLQRLGHIIQVVNNNKSLNEALKFRFIEDGKRLSSKINILIDRATSERD